MPVQLEIQKLPQTQLVLVKEPHVFYTSLLVHGAPEPDAADECRFEMSLVNAISLLKQTHQDCAGCTAGGKSMKIVLDIYPIWSYVMIWD